MMRQQGADSITIVKQIAKETMGSEVEHDRPSEASRTREQEIDEVLRESRQRQLDWERGIDPDRDNDRGLGIE
jgi:predicted secreted Zn-dependent protease